MKGSTNFEVIGPPALVVASFAKPEGEYPQGTDRDIPKELLMWPN
jgi:hypothetical protein